MNFKDGKKIKQLDNNINNYKSKIFCTIIILNILLISFIFGRNINEKILYTDKIVPLITINIVVIIYYKKIANNLKSLIIIGLIYFLIVFFTPIYYTKDIIEDIIKDPIVHRTESIHTNYYNSYNIHIYTYVDEIGEGKWKLN